MKQLVYSHQQVELDATPFLLPDVIRSCTFWLFLASVQCEEATSTIEAVCCTF